MSRAISSQRKFRYCSRLPSTPVRREASHRDVDGLKFPFEVDTDSPGMGFIQKLTIARIELNPQIDDSRFAKPAALPASGSAAPPAPAKENPERQKKTIRPMP
jgi:hypothetical protein